jgi:hypothetical protein
VQLDKLLSGCSGGYTANITKPRGKPIGVFCFVDTNHGGCWAMQRLHTSILIYFNCSSVIWYTKQQNTVKSATFGPEFIAMQIAVELIEGLRYKLQMLEIPIEGLVDVFCNNNDVV